LSNETFPLLKSWEVVKGIDTWLPWHNTEEILPIEMPDGAGCAEKLPVIPE
jgi:hypothetical protein